VYICANEVEISDRKLALKI